MWIKIDDELLNMDNVDAVYRGFDNSSEKPGIIFYTKNGNCVSFSFESDEERDLIYCQIENAVGCRFINGFATKRKNDCVQEISEAERKAIEEDDLLKLVAIKKKRAIAAGKKGCMTSEEYANRHKA